MAMGTFTRECPLACSQACRFLLAALLACLLSSAPGPALAARSAAEAQDQLQQVQTRIKAVTAAVQADIERRDRVAADLRDAEQAVRAAQDRLDDVRTQRATAERKRAALQADQKRETQAMEAERDALAGQLKAAYVNGHEEQLKLLLNARDPAQLGRMLVYYSYFGKARADKIAEIQGRVARLDQLEAEIAAEDAKLAALEQEGARQLDSVKVARTGRERALGAVRAQIATRDAELKRLKQNEARLTQLIAKLQRAVEDFPAFDGDTPFARVKGKLPWPVRGDIVAQYGEPRGGGLRWNGMLVQTDRGAQVRVPYYGRVVYADWLTGLGLLLIVDHGGGYLSLYGHNEQLFRSVGDRVAPGDVIGSVGDSGGANRPELYFEIRRGARPLDPRQWLVPRR
jgi:septal ring factor EnvC (AmiA/AmiB activator)